MDTTSSSGLPQQSPLSAIPGLDLSSLGGDGSSFGSSNIDFSSLPYGGNPFAGDNLFTIFGNGVNPLTVGDPYASSSTISTSTPAASATVSTPAASDSTSTTAASSSTDPTTATSDSSSLLQQSPLAQIPGFDPTSISIDPNDNPFTALAAVFPNLDLSSYIGGGSTAAASGSTSTTTANSDFLRQSPFGPLLDIPGVTPDTLFGGLGGGTNPFANVDFSSLPYGGNPFAGNNLFTLFGNGVNPLTVGDPYASGNSTNPVAGDSTSIPTTSASGTPAATGTSDSSSLLQQSPLAAIPGVDPTSISIGGNPFTGAGGTSTASDGSSIPQQSPFDLASAALGNNSPFISGGDLSSFLLNVFGQGGSPLDSNNQAIIFGGSNNPFASIGDSVASGDNPFADGANPFVPSADNPFAGTTDDPYASGTASITAQNAPVGQFNTDVGNNNATIGNGNWSFGDGNATIGNGIWNFGDGNATIGNGNWLLNSSSDNTTLGNGNWYRNASNKNETLGNGNWYFGSDNATIGNGNWDFGTNNIVIGNGNWVFTSNSIVIGNGEWLSPSSTSSIPSTLVPGLETSVDSLISSLVGNFGQDFVELTGNLDSAELQTLDQLILSKGGNSLLAQKAQPVPEPGFSADIAVLGIALLLWLSFKKGFSLQKLAFRLSK